MPNEPTPTLLEAQRALHAWSLQNADERARRFREARDAGVEPDQIAKLTGLPMGVVEEALGEVRRGPASFATAWS